MSTVLVAGSTGHLGQALLPALAAAGHEVVAMARPASRHHLDHLQECIQEVREGDASEPDSLPAVLAGIDTVVSAIGLTKPVKHLDFDQVDRQCNENLLDAAVTAGVERFVYTSVAGIDLPDSEGVAILDAKRRFEEALRGCSIGWSIARPSGYFWNYGLFLQMAREHGVVPILGDGEAKTTPVAEQDVAAAMARRLLDDGETYTIGGPEDLSANAIAALIGEALGRKVRAVHVPEPVTRLALEVTKPFSRSEYDMWAFFHWTMTAGATADHLGSTHLAAWLQAHRDDDF